MKGPGTSQRRSNAAPATISVRVQPRASKNEVRPQADGSFKVRLTAPPVDGAANEALIRFLADALGVAKSAVEIVSGQTSRDKVVRVTGVSEGDARRLLKGGRE